MINYDGIFMLLLLLGVCVHLSAMFDHLVLYNLLWWGSVVLRHTNCMPIGVYTHH